MEPERDIEPEEPAHIAEKAVSGAEVVFAPFVDAVRLVDNESGDALTEFGVLPELLCKQGRARYFWGHVDKIGTRADVLPRRRRLVGVFVNCKGVEAFRASLLNLISSISGC